MNLTVNENRGVGLLAKLSNIQLKDYLNKQYDFQIQIHYLEKPFKEIQDFYGTVGEVFDFAEQELLKINADNKHKNKFSVVFSEINSNTISPNILQEQFLQKLIETSALDFLYQIIQSYKNKLL
jgi:hypothetical protein